MPHPYNPYHELPHWSRASTLHIQPDPPDWAKAAIAVLQQYRTHHGHAPKVAAMSPKAIDQMRSYLKERPTHLLGIPIECDPSIDGIEFRDEARYCQCNYFPKPAWICATCNKRVDQLRDK